MKNFVFTYNAKLTENGATVNEGLKPASTFTVLDIQEDNGGGHINIATGAVDVEQPLGLVNEARFLILETTETISVKLNDDANTAIVIRADGTPKKGILVLTSSSITTLFFSNSSGNAAKVGIFFGS